MRFFFPDCQDFVDPSFDFETETRSETRFRQRDDKYPHEIFSRVPYQGMLVSKAIVDGSGSGARGKYTVAQRQRIYRVGVREFFRLDAIRRKHRIETMGDCGAFSYIKQEVPPFGIDEVLNYYVEVGFDFGVSVDHVILSYSSRHDSTLPGMESENYVEWQRRQDITLKFAEEFLVAHKRQRLPFYPIGVAQGWSPDSYSHAVNELQKIGFDYIAIGGLVPLRTADILQILAAVSKVRRRKTRLHLFGVTRCENTKIFKASGVVSFDSTSPLLKAFKDNKNNYYWGEGAYTAIRVPQVQGNNALEKMIASGQIEQEKAIKMEGRALDLLKKFDRGKSKIDTVLNALSDYDNLLGIKKRPANEYRQLLEDQPWKHCKCEVCRQLGIHVVIFRGAERNRRRGFHNLHHFYNSLQKEIEKVQKNRESIANLPNKGRKQIQVAEVV